MRYDNVTVDYITYHDIISKIFCVFNFWTDGDCEIPEQFQGDFFSMERGHDVNTIITYNSLRNHLFDGICIDRRDDNSSYDAYGNHDSKLMFREV